MNGAIPRSLSEWDWPMLDARALGRLMSALEAGTPTGRRAAAALQARVWPGVSVGVTGPPGCGKSTLVAALIKVLRERGETVGVLAIDPSSIRGGGALLGDRVRMMDFASDERVVIRSIGARGHAGGLAPAVADLARLLRAAGCGWVLVETVGVGQGEIDVAAQTDVILVVQAPGAGDDIQALKKGLLEIADLWVVNKADLPGAEQLERALVTWVAAGAPEAVCRTQALTGEGVATLLERINERRATAPQNDPAATRAAEIRRHALGLLGARLDRRLREAPLPPGDTWQAAEQLVAELLSHPLAEGRT